MVALLEDRERLAGSLLHFPHMYRSPFSGHTKKVNSGKLLMVWNFSCLHLAGMQCDVELEEGNITKLVKTKNVETKILWNE